MEFYTASYEPRPVRLNEKTRLFAWESLNHRYGLDTEKTPYVSLDDIKNFDSLTDIDKYDISVERIARDCPIRICENERISGAATLGMAINHWVPASFNGKVWCYGVSHLTVDFAKVLRIGWNGIEKEVTSSLDGKTDEKEKRFLTSCLRCINALRTWHARYLDALEGKSEYKENHENLLKVPFSPAKTFHEALQSIWFTFAFLRLCGCWPGFGRLDAMLYPYLKKDLAEGRTTIEDARDVLAHFFIKGCEWITGKNVGSGDAQHYQNIVISGIDENGNDVTNDVTYLILDVIEELSISDFPTVVRLSSKTDEKLLRRTAEVIRHGGGTVAVYNEDMIISSLTKYGYPLCEAREFANDGCWEIQIPGKTCFSYVPFDSLRLFQKYTLDDYSGAVAYDCFEDMFESYKAALTDQVGAIFDRAMRSFESPDVPPEKMVWKDALPCTLVSLLEEGCIQKGRSYFEGGPVYTVISPHIGGIPDVANAMYAIKKFVFDEKKLTFAEFTEVLKNDWENHEELRLYVKNRYSYYGNDNDEVDCIASDILSAFSAICASFDGRSPISFPSGVSTFGRQIEWSASRLASPHGRKKGDVLSGNCSPTPGSDAKGATAIIRSYCKSDLSEQVTGAALDMPLLPSSIKGEEGLEAIISLLRGFVCLGGCFMQIDAVNADVLRDAQEHPENYQTLSVRVSGWNARFVTLNRAWQNMIIERDTK